MDEICNQAAKMCYMTGGQAKVPIVIRTPLLGSGGAAAQHSGRPEAWCVHTPGLKIAIPSTPYDVKGLLKTAIRDDNPVVFFEHVFLYDKKGPVPREEFMVPFGKALIARQGSDVTLVATSRMVRVSLDAAETLENDGISVEVIDPRTLVPLDTSTIVSSVRKTGRLVTVTEESKRGSVAAEISTLVTEEAFDYLDAPTKRVCALDVPIPFSPPMEEFVLPNREAVVRAVKEICSRKSSGG